MGMRVWHAMLKYTLDVWAWSSYQKHSLLSYSWISTWEHYSQYNNNNSDIQQQLKNEFAFVEFLDLNHLLPISLQIISKYHN